MTKIIQNIKELIGNTPLLKLNHMGFEHINIYAKLELLNPGGSVKDRIGLAMIHDAESNGLLRPGSTIIESTAGNTGIGVALAAINSGYNVIFTVPEKFSQEKVVIMQAYGATVIRTPRADGMEGAKQEALRLLQEIPNSISLRQFENLANPEIHYSTTGKEIYDALAGKIDYFIAGAGSGGTFSGVAKYLKERIPHLQTVLADPLGSIMGGGQCGNYEIEGIGNGFIPETMNMSLVDHVVKISDNDALRNVNLLSAQEGVLVGSSSGAAFAGIEGFIDNIPVGSNVVTIFPDRGDRYFSKNIFNI